MELILFLTFKDNRRFTVEPAVVVYPTNPTEVAEVLQIAWTYNYSAVARSGGVRTRSSEIDSC